MRLNIVSLKLSLVIIGLLFFSTSNILAQNKKRKITIERVKTLEMDNDIARGAQRLIGDVILRHGEILLHCDSAYFYSDDKADAFGNVHIEQGDTANLYCDTLYYDSNKSYAKLRGNVRLLQKDFTLKTNFLNQNFETNTGNYYHGGHIVDNKSNNVLTSEKGTYFSTIKDFYFKDSVVLVNPDYTIYSDTLRYNSGTDITYFYGPTNIVSDSTVIYCENGWYNSKDNLSKFWTNAKITSETTILQGDTINYNGIINVGEALCNVTMQDTTQEMLVTGDYAIHFQNNDSTLVTEDAQFIQYHDADTMRLHADTLLIVNDTSTHDSTKLILGYRKVKFHQAELSGQADSLVYMEKDSSIHLFYDPILWAQNYQITGEKIILETDSGEISTMKVIENSFIASRYDSLSFNQIKGKNMDGYFRNNRMYQLVVKGSGETVYFVAEENEGGKKIGANKAVGERIVIRLAENKIQNISIIEQPIGALHPMHDLPRNELILTGFRWREHLKPKTWYDIFKWGETKEIVQ